MDFGYIRVSAKDQNDARQMAALQAAGVPPRNIYREKKSGKDFDRPAIPRPDDADQCAALWRSGQIRLQDLAARRGVPFCGAQHRQIAQKRTQKRPDFWTAFKNGVFPSYFWTIYRFFAIMVK